MAKKNEKRYDGKDSVPWVVVDHTGKRIAKNESHDGFSGAVTAARRYTEATGQYAAAVRM